MEELFTGTEHLLAENLAHDVAEYSQIAPELFDKYQVKRGLRNIDGTGVKMCIRDRIGNMLG